MQQFQPSTMTGLPPLPASFHFIGIGGIGMSGLARILHDRGYQVSGSDRQASPVTDGLERMGIPVQIGHGQSELAGAADVLVVTPRAIPGAPKEIAAAVAHGAEVVRRGQLLAMIANSHTSVAVAGSHGKSTTSGMIASALTAIGDDPTYAIGAVVGSTGHNAAPGAGRHMVVEADEFDRALLWLTPDVAIITTISFDHPDCFVDQADYDQVFVDFVRRMPPTGTLITSADNPGCQRLLTSLSASGAGPASVLTFGQGDRADWRYDRDGDVWRLQGPDGAMHRLHLQVPGVHNAANATAALMALTQLGVSADDAIRGLEAFSGVGRRFEHKGAAGGIDVIDDYGHHPDEIRATLAGTRERYPERRVVALFQPHTFSRTALLLDDFAAAMALADVPVLLDVYPAGEENAWGVTSASVADRIPGGAPVLPVPDDAVRWLAEHARPGDVVLTIGAGDVTVVGDRLLAALRERQRTRASGQ